MDIESKITKEEYINATDIVEKYKVQSNKSLIKSHTCICCKTKEIKHLEMMGIPEVMEQDRGCWNDGWVHKISQGYGSRFDMSQFFIAICDDCLEGLIKDGLATNVKDVRKSVKELFNIEK